MDSKSKSSLSYVLFLYREQLRQVGEIQSMRLNRTKLTLTDKLIKKTVRNLDKCTVDDMLAINREIMFKKKLKYRLQRMHQLRKSLPNQATKEVERK